MVHNKKGKVIMNSLPGCDADDIKNMTLKILKFRRKSSILKRDFIYLFLQNR